jgi:hypothetical protein
MEREAGHRRQEGAMRSSILTRVVVTLMAVGIGWPAVCWQPSVAHAGPPHPFHLDLMLMIADRLRTAPEPDVVPLGSVASTPSPGASVTVPGEQATAPSPAAQAQIITAGDLRLLRPALPGSAIAVPGGGFIATPGDAPVYVGPPGTQRAKILTP